MTEKIDKSIEEIHDWTKENGLYPLKSPELDCNYITSITATELEKMPLEELEELMLKMASYNLFLKSLKGSIEAEIIITEADLRKDLYLQTNNLSTEPGQFKTNNEKEAIVFTMDSDLNELHRHLIVLKGQLSRMKDLPFAVDTKLNIVKLKYQRRKANERPGQY
jgi:hypothetical protein